MSTDAPARTMSTEELMALAEDGVERDLIEGRLRERPLTRRSRSHSRAEARIAQLLANWLETRPEPRGEVVSGEAAFRLRRDPDTTVGIDVAYVSAEVAALEPARAFFEGPPVLAVEILSASDRQDDVDDKVEAYLSSGVSLVWLVSPRFRTVTVYRPDAPPVLYNDQQDLTAEPHLPGFRTPVARLFGV
ncbi:MAG: Uma2 family endonuclease [Isosphaeraceae bacterium]